MALLMRMAGFAELPVAVADFAGATTIDFAILLTAGSRCVPGRCAIAVLFTGFLFAAYIVAELAAPDTVFSRSRILQQFWCRFCEH